MEYRYWSQYEGRGVTEQVLDLSQNQKNVVYAYLEKNLLPENREYAYKFFFDNCSTRLRDVLAHACGEELVWNTNIRADSTYRQWIDLYANANKKYWSDFGMDLAIGIPSDSLTGYAGAMFLPDNLMHALRHAKIGGKAAVLFERTLAPVRIQPEDTFWSPLVVFSIVFVLVLLFSWLELKKGWRMKALDILLFSITSLLGVLIIVLWFFTSHGVTALNLNLLWALPFGIMPFVTRKFSPKKVLYSMLFCFSAVLLLFKFWPQDLHPAIIPVVGILLTRTFIQWKKIS